MEATKVFEAYGERAREVAKILHCPYCDEALAPDEEWINTVSEVEIYSDGGVYFNDNDSATMYLNTAILESQVEYLRAATINNIEESE